MEKYVAATLTRQNVDKKPDNFLREYETKLTIYNLKVLDVFQNIKLIGMQF